MKRRQGDAPVNVLLAESDADYAGTLQAYLVNGENGECHVSHVDALAGAIARVRAGGIDVVLLGLSLPDAKGLDVIRRFVNAAPGVPVVALTRVSDNGLSLESIKAGAHEYVHKEADPLFVCRAIRYAMERQHATEALRQSERKFKDIVDRAPLGIYQSHMDGRFTMVNDALVRFLGYGSKEDLLQASIADSVYFNKQQRRALIDRYEHRSAVVDLEVAWKKKDGSPIWVQLTAHPIKDDRGNTISFEGFVRDITARKRTEHALRASEALNSTILNSISAEIAVLDGNGRVAAVNNAWKEFARHHSKGSLAGCRIGTDYLEVCRNAALAGNVDARRMLEGIQGVLRGAQQEFVVEYPCRSAEGSRWFVAKVTPLTGGRGGVVLVHMDVTERKDAEMALQQSEKRFRTLIQNSSDVISVIHEDGTILYESPAVARVLGFQPEELVGENAFDLIHPDDRDDAFRELAGLIHEPGSSRSSQFRFQNKAGEWRWLEATGSFVNGDQSTPGIVVNYRDITDRKHAEENLRIAEERYRSIFERVPVGIYQSTLDGRYLALNRKEAQIVGYDSPEELVAANIDLNTQFYVKPGRREEFVRQLTVRGSVTGFESEVWCKDGSTTWVSEDTRPLFDGQGTLIGFEGTTTDISLRKMLEQQLIQSQKMESIGTLAGGIAHDFNNVLGIILGHATLLEQSLENPVKASRSVKTIQQAVHRATGLVRQILMFARRSEVSYEAVDLNEAVQEVQEMIVETFPRSIVVVSDIDPLLCPIEGDRTQIHQTILNLCVNARDAMPGGGALTITTSMVSGDEVRGQVPGVAGEQFACMTVSDTGIGMDEIIRGKIFEPFFTTKEKGEGTGLGLAVVYGIVKNHRGHIAVASAPGKGTTFNMYFPLFSTLRVEGNVPAKHVECVQGGNETILVVEDEELLSELLKALLESSGYTVMTATDGCEAVDLYRTHRAGISLVLTDLGLPKMGGLEVFQEIRAMNPDARVLLASGYIDRETRQQILNAGAKGLVLKPYIPDEILRRVREAVDCP